MLASLKSKLTSNQPERSPALRRLVFMAMLLPLLALARVSVLWPHVLAAAVGIGLGHWYSYRHLEKPNQLLRGLMFVAVHLALCWLFVGLVSGAPVPQAQFAIFAQAITSFDLRYRSSLLNTLIHSFAILYVAASLSRTVELAVYLLLFAALVLAVFFTVEKETGLKRARLRPTSPGASAPRRVLPTPDRSMTIFGFSFSLIVIPAIMLAFIFTPRFSNNPIVPPLTFNIPLRGGISAEIINPGVPLVQINGWSNEVGDYFIGFDTNLDLRYRGGLSDAVVMYVRSPSRSYWRSHSYDTYTGVSWTQSDDRLVDVERRVGVVYELPRPPGAPPARAGRAAPEEQEIVQSFTIVREQPNLIFAAYRPSQVFITAERVSLDNGDGLRVPEPLKPGLTYSVISRRPEFAPDRLRQASTDYPADIARRYLQLPANISERTRALARNLAAPYDNDFDRVTALANYLLAEYPYNFFPPPHPPGAEAVDTFLFEDRQGFCEQYVTALVVMARSLGIPARLAAGYGSGDYNPVTNYYEVRFSHAHSWAEVYFPEYGWVPFDPTPGWTPQPYPTPVQNWLFANSGHFFGLDVPALPVAGLVAGSSSILAVLMPGIIIAALGAGLVFLIITLSRRLRLALAARAAGRYTPLVSDPERRHILKLYRQAIRLLTARQHRPRANWESLTEYARRIGPLPALARLTHLAEIAAYRPQAPDPESVVEAKTALAELKDELAGG
jgi:transglutaminase-like putative cysteine protease